MTTQNQVGYGLTWVDTTVLVLFTLSWGIGCGRGPSDRASVSCESSITAPLLNLGTVSAGSTACAAGGLDGADCYQATVSCPEVEDADVTLKFHASTTNTLGTVILTTGGGGSSLYEDDFTYGPDLVSDLNAAGFATIQVAWTDSWTEGSGGVARAACRYATLARWIYDELHAVGDTQPLCATGNSGGSAQVAYAMTRYGFDQQFDALVLSSGPPYGRIDLGCDCTPGIDVADVPCGDANLCYSRANIEAVDAAYEGSPCEDQCVDILVADSVVANGVDLDYPATKVIAVFGGQDNSNALAQAVQWYDAITSDVEIICVPEAGHSMASSLEGYEVLRDQLVAECKLQP